jgi:hypothetical protein
MGKSIRSKRKKRLRTLKREIVEPHYNAKDASKEAAMEAALLAPKVEIPNKRKPSEMGKFSRWENLVCFVASVLGAATGLQTG